VDRRTDPGRAQREPLGQQLAQHAHRLRRRGQQLRVHRPRRGVPLGIVAQEILSVELVGHRQRRTYDARSQEGEAALATRQALDRSGPARSALSLNPLCLFFRQVRDVQLQGEAHRGSLSGPRSVADRVHHEEGLLAVGAASAAGVLAAVALGQEAVPIRIAATVRVTPDQAGTSRHPQGVRIDVGGTVEAPGDVARSTSGGPRAGATTAPGIPPARGRP
jgi:hypothetical protein